MFAPSRFSPLRGSLRGGPPDEDDDDDDDDWPEDPVAPPHTSKTLAYAVSLAFLGAAATKLGEWAVEEIREHFGRGEVKK